MGHSALARPLYSAAAATLCIVPAHAQSGSAESVATLNAEVSSLLPDNNTGTITPYAMRQLELDLIASALIGVTTPFPLSTLAPISSRAILGNPTASLGSVTAGYEASNATDTTVPLVHGSVISGHCLEFSDTVGTIVDAGAACGSGGSTSLTVGSTVVVGGTSGYLLYDNGGTLGNLATTGSGNAVLATSPTVSGLTATGSFTATGLVTNADLANPATTVNGVACTLGSTCTAPAAAGTLTGATLASGVTASSLTSVGTLVGLTASGVINPNGGILLSGAPPYAATFQGNSGAGSFWLSAAATAASNTLNEWVAQFPMTSATGSSNHITATKGGIYASCVANSGSGDCYGANFIASASSGLGSVANTIAVEANVDNNNQNYGSSTAFSYNSSGPPQQYGVTIATSSANDGTYSFRSTGAIYIAALAGSSTVGAGPWGYGTFCDHNSISYACFMDASNGTASYTMLGTHTVGIDMSGAALTNGIQLPNNVPILAANTSGAQQNLITLSGSNTVNLGNTSDDIFVVSPAMAPTSNGASALGASGFAFSLVWTQELVLAEAFTVSTLPTCNSGAEGMLAYVTDALSPTYNGALTGGSSTIVPVFCNGSAWRAH